jgi:hypothetical protein
MRLGEERCENGAVGRAEGLKGAANNPAEKSDKRNKALHLSSDILC